MTLSAYRSQHVEALVDGLAGLLSSTWPADPFASVPIVVGSRGMDRWLRHELATRHGSVARVSFLFPGTAFEAAAHGLLEGKAISWDDPRAAEGPWSPARLTLRVLEGLRRRLGEPDFARVAQYLGQGGDEVGPRELAFAQEVAGAIGRLLHDRPVDALAWVRDPESARKAPRGGDGAADEGLGVGEDLGEDHVWLARLVADLHEGVEPSPAQTLGELRTRPPRAGPASEARQALIVFGLSTLRPGDRLRLEALSRHLDVHLFTLAPSSQWWADIHSTREVRAALKKAGRPQEAVALLAESDRQNALLAGCGVPSRDFQVWLEALDYGEPKLLQASPRPAARKTLLTTVQRWIDDAADNPSATEAPPWATHAGCTSLEVHACHGPLRQCEALRDELLRRFAEDPSLEPRHVLVMTPDVTTFAPLLAAVFARQSPGTPSIPLHIADLGISSTNPVADALLQALALADERVTAARLLDLLALRPVRERFGLADEDLADLRVMLVSSGARWAWDGADRARHQQPELDQHTLRFGLERLALGVLMHDPGGLTVVAAPADDVLTSADKGVSLLGPAVPVELGNRDRVERFGRLAELCDVLRRLRDDVLVAATPAQWRVRLRELLDALTLVEGNAAWLRVQVDETLASLLPEGAGAELRLSRSALSALLRGSFDLPQKGDRPITGAVTVCSLEPMRSVPFRVVAVVGLDDGAFPRAGRLPAWEPFARPRPGEHDRRTVDRHLFLEALLCARDALLLFGTGFEPARGAAAPLSVVATEVAEVIAAGVGVRKPEDVLIPHALQPWSTKAFAKPQRLPFDPVWVAGAKAIAGERVQAGLAATKLDAQWPSEERAPGLVSADDLATALARPQKALLGGRLGLALEPVDTEVPEREPIEHGTLESWAIRDRVLDALGEDAVPTVDTLEARLRAEGALPLRAGGRRALEECVEEAQQVGENVKALGGTTVPAGQWSWSVGEVVVSAGASQVRALPTGLELVFTTASKQANERTMLLGWLTLLVAKASGGDVAAVHLVGYDASSIVTLTAPDTALQAQQHLASLVAQWRGVLTSPVRLFPKLSPALVKARRKSPQATASTLVSDNRKAWEGGHMSRGDLDDPFVAGLFGHLTVEELQERADELLEVAERVWGPLFDAAARADEAEKAAKATAKAQAAAQADGEAEAERAAKAEAKVRAKAEAAALKEASKKPAGKKR